MVEHKTEHKKEKHETKHEAHTDAKHATHHTASTHATPHPAHTGTHTGTHTTHDKKAHHPTHHAAHTTQRHPNKHKAHITHATHTTETKSQSAIRIMKKKKPKFNVLNAGFMRSVKERWRKPRGTHNKKRMRLSWAGASPRVGYRNPESIRNLHPSGKPEILIHNLNELQNASGKLVRVAAQVGRRKRTMIEAKAKELGLIIINMAKIPENKMVKQ